MFRNALLALSLISVGSLSAQTVFIPDVNLRTWLNAAKPNSVDLSGYCDTAAWNAVPPASVGAALYTLPNGTPVDLEGIQYLKIAQFSITGGGGVTYPIAWPGHPRANTMLYLNYLDLDLFTGAFLPLPATLDRFFCNVCTLSFFPAFNGSELWYTATDLSGQLITIASSVTDLRLHDCGITQIPVIPNVTHLELNDDPLASWTNLPNGLTYLEVDNVGLTSLPPSLPPGLLALTARSNGLTSLPPLPAGLTDLRLANNLLISLPDLPTTLQVLEVNNNPITGFSPFHWGLQSLYASFCTFTTIPPFPPGSILGTLQLQSNPSLNNLPPLPNILSALIVSDCPSLTCLPTLPQGMTALNIVGSGITCLPNLPPGLSGPLCNVATTPCPLMDPLITGTAFNDANGDGLLDVGESARPNSVVMAQPGNLLAGSDINGHYVLPADIGTFAVSGVPQLYTTTTTAPYNVTFTAPGQVDSLKHIGFAEIPGMFDLTSRITGNVVRPGFNTALWVTVRNVGTEPVSAQVQLTADASPAWLGSDITPDNLVGNVADWTTAVLAPGAEWTVHVDLFAPPSLPLGTPVVQQATATPTGQTEQTPVDNADVLNDVVVGSYDPNDKQVEPEQISPEEVAAGTPVRYTVRFQNTGTFMATRVLITDTLSTDLQPTTMRFVGSSHPCTWYIRHGVLHVLFNNIDLPASASDEPNSHGFVTFTFVPLNTLQLGAAVANVANIYFDYNTPIITNAAVFTVEAPLGLPTAATDDVRLWPNPATDALYLRTTEPVIDAVAVVDVTGRVVQRAPATGMQQVLHVDALAAGTYTLQYMTSKGVRSARFVKQ